MKLNAPLWLFNAKTHPLPISFESRNLLRQRAGRRRWWRRRIYSYSMIL